MAPRSYHAPATRKTELVSGPRKPSEGSDPLLNMIEHFERHRAMHDASDEKNPRDGKLEDIFVSLHTRLCEETPECRTDEGAFAAMALAGYELEHHAHSDLADALLKAVAVYARRRPLNT